MRGTERTAPHRRLQAEIRSVDASPRQWWKGDVEVDGCSVDAQGISEAALETGPGVAWGEIDRSQVDSKFGVDVV